MKGLDIKPENFPQSNNTLNAIVIYKTFWQIQKFFLHIFLYVSVFFNFDWQG